MIDRRDSASGSSRTLSPVAFFHDGFFINKTDLQKNFMDAQRRAQAIATAPRRKRHDDDDEEADEAKKSILFFLVKISLFFINFVFLKALLGYIKTSALPIPISHEGQHPHSLPQTESGSNLLPTFRVDPPSQDDLRQVDHTFNHTPRLNRCPSAPLPSRNQDWKD